VYQLLFIVSIQLDAVVRVANDLTLGQPHRLSNSLAASNYAQINDRPVYFRWNINPAVSLRNNLFGVNLLVRHTHLIRKIIFLA
jgi:hypothetical protein